jgi:hypothetical protein
MKMAEDVVGPVLMPNLERLRLWVDDLLTTTASQRKGTLRRDDSYCCLGRAIEVAMANGCEVEVAVKAWGESTVYTYDGVADFLPREVAVWYGIPSNPTVGERSQSKGDCATPGCPCGGRGISATEANDGEGWSFKQIGESIRKHYRLDGDQ